MTRLAGPAPQEVLVPGQLDEVMRRAALLEVRVSADRAARVLERGRLIRAAAVLASVAVLILGPAHRAFTADVPVRQEALVHPAVDLEDVPLLDRAVGAQRLEDAARVLLVLR